MPRMIKKLPHNARFDYEDVCGFKHYHTNNRWYLVWRNRTTKFIKSFAKNEE